MKHHKLEFTAAGLRWIALGCMLLDHIWGTLVPGNDWMTYLGRIAFPIFAFQISEGYLHTRDFRKYHRRIALFALLSEIPFDLMMFQTPFYPFHQNVMITLWIGLFCIRVIDQVRKKAVPAALGCIQLLGLFLLGYVTFSDYGLLGVLNVVIFYLLRDFPGAKAAQLAAMIAIHVFGFQGRAFVFSLLGCTVEIPVQAFALLSLIPIWLYRGKKGTQGRFLSCFSYAFYPLHMLVLYVLQII